MLWLLFIRPLGYNPFHFRFPVKFGYLNHWTLFNLSFLIFGIALVFKDFDAPIHTHREEETYIFVWGTGNLHLDGKGM